MIPVAGDADAAGSGVLEPLGSTSGETGFDAFYQREYAPVVRLAYVLTGRLAVAEEMAQDAFLAAFGAWEKIRAFDRPDAWVRRVVANKCVSAWRRGATEARVVARLRRERVVEPSIPEPDDEVWRAIRALPRRQRQVLALLALEDRSVADVAGLLGCSVDSVRTHLRRGRAALAGRLREPDPGEEEP